MKGLATFVVLTASLSVASAQEKQHVDLYGDTLPHGAVARLGSARLRHVDDALCLAFSLDGKWLASGGTKEVRVWDVETGRQLREFVGISAQSLAFSPDGGLLVAGGHVGELHFLDVRTGEMRPFEEKHGNAYVFGVAFSPDGKTVATAANEANVRLWDAATGSALGSLEMAGERTDPGTLEFSPDGRLLLCIAKQCFVWDVRTRRRLAVLDHKPGEAFAMAAFGPSGGTVFAASGFREKFIEEGKLTGIDIFSRFCEWDVVSRKLVRELDSRLYYRHREGAPDFEAESHFAVDVAPKQKRAAVIRDGAIDIWDIAAGRVVRSLKKWSSRQVKFSPHGELLAATDWAAVRLWNVGSGEERFAARVGHVSIIRAIEFSPDNKTIATGSMDSTMRLWDAATGEQLRELSYGFGEVFDIAFSADGRFVAAAGGPIDVWEVETGRRVQRIEAVGDEARIAFSPDSHTIAACGHSILWGIPGNNADHNWALVDGPVHLFDVKTGRKLRTLVGHKGWVDSLKFSRDGRTLYSYGKGGVRIWDLQSTGDSRLVPLRNAVADDAQFIDETLVATYYEEVDLQGLMCWDTRTGRRVGWVPGRFDSSVGANPIAVTPSGWLLAAMSQGSVHVFERISGAEVHTLPWQSSHIGAIAFSPDGKKLVNGRYDGMALVWQMPYEHGLRNAQPAAETFEKHWQALAGEDAVAARRAVRALASGGESAVRYLDQQLPPLEELDKKLVARLIAQLEDERFPVREEATAELKSLGPRVIKSLEKVAETTTSPEVRSRCRKVVDAILHEEDLQTSPRILQRLRALEVLERIQTPAAVALVRRISDNQLEVRVTAEAKRILSRGEQGIGTR